MTLLIKITFRNLLFYFLFFLMSLNVFAQEQTTHLPSLESVLQKGFPTQSDALLQITNALFDEYTQTQNVASLVFYSYGMLRLANHYKTVNDYVKASEFAKLGFFSLDEIVDLHENDLRIRYLRARVDAYLPADLGRCVVTLDDTQILLDNALSTNMTTFDINTMAHIRVMRYRALQSCGETKQAEAMLAGMQQDNVTQNLLTHSMNSAPDWDISEIMQVVVPLMKGE